MNRLSIAAAVASLAVLAGCSTTTAPAQPPASEDALTTSAPPADAAAATTEVEATEEAAADEPPEMPAEAKEQTEAGAEAFALHYIDLINYTGMNPQTGLLEPLGADGCDSCENYEENVASLISDDAANDGPAADIHGVQSVVAGQQHVVLVDLQQNPYVVRTDEGKSLRKYEAIAGVQFKFTLSPAEPWIVEEIQVSTTR